MESNIIGSIGICDLEEAKIIKLKQINDWCVQSRVSRLDACIHFVKKNNMIDFMVVGFDDVTHLKKIIKSFKKKKINVSAKFETKNNDLIDPRRWKL